MAREPLPRTEVGKLLQWHPWLSRLAPCLWEARLIKGREFDPRQCHLFLIFYVFLNSGRRPGWPLLPWLATGMYWGAGPKGPRPPAGTPALPSHEQRG